MKRKEKAGLNMEESCGGMEISMIGTGEKRKIEIFIGPSLWALPNLKDVLS